MISAERNTCLAAPRRIDGGWSTRNMRVNQLVGSPSLVGFMGATSGPPSLHILPSSCKPTFSLCEARARQLHTFPWYQRPYPKESYEISRKQKKREFCGEVFPLVVLCVSEVFESLPSWPLLVFRVSEDGHPHVKGPSLGKVRPPSEPPSPLPLVSSSSISHSPHLHSFSSFLAMLPFPLPYPDPLSLSRLSPCICISLRDLVDWS